MTAAAKTQDQVRKRKERERKNRNRAGGRTVEPTAERWQHGGVRTIADVINEVNVTDLGAEYAEDDRVTCVYVIAQKRNGPYKIGMSADPSERIKQIQTWNYFYVYDAFWAARRTKAGLIEKKAHKLLKEQGRHLKGEWFSVGVRQAEKAIRAAFSYNETSIIGRGVDADLTSYCDRGVK